MGAYTPYNTAIPTYPGAPYGDPNAYMQRPLPYSTQPQYQYGQSPAQAPNPPASTINGRAVTGMEEAVAAQIPLDGSISIFTDFGHNKIYTKQLNFQDGSAIFRTYELVQKQPNTSSQSENAPAAVEYAPMSELDSLRAELKSLRAELEENKKIIATAARKPAAKGGATE